MAIQFGLNRHGKLVDLMIMKDGPRSPTDPIMFCSFASPGRNRIFKHENRLRPIASQDGKLTLILPVGHAFLVAACLIMGQFC